MFKTDTRNHTRFLSNHTLWEPVELALMGAGAVIAVRNKGTYHVADNN